MAAQTTTIPNGTIYASGQPPVVVSGPTNINNGVSNTVAVSSGATVTFHATDIIILKPGFHASSGSKFFAVIGTGADSDSDGMPDAWERAYGLVVGTNDAGSDADGDGISNFTEYLIGTKPNGGTSNTNDSSTPPATALKVHRPNTP